MTVGGYARVSRWINGDARRQVRALQDRGIDSEYIWTDWGLAGRPRPTPALDEALQTTAGGTLTVTSLARLANSAGDLQQVLTRMATDNSSLAVDGTIHTPDTLQQMNEALRWLLPLDADLTRLRAAERAATPPRTEPRGGYPTLTPLEEDRAAELFAGGQFPPAELAAILGVSRSSLYRVAAAPRRRRRPSQGG